MRKINHFVLVISLFAFVTLACGTGASRATPDNQATIEAAVAGTGTAQAANQAIIDAAVQATTAAQQAEEPAEIDTTTSQDTDTTPADSQSSSVAVSTSTPVEAYMTMTEEELAALINQALTEATAATEQVSTATTNATSDSPITQEEVESLEIYVSGAEEAIAYAEQLLSAYDSLYGELATETIEELNEIEQALDEISTSTAALDDTLQEVNSTLEQGLELAEETITQLETTAQAAGNKAGEVQQQTQNWMVNHQVELDNRIGAAIAVQPNQVADNPKEAVQSAIDFINVAQQATADNRISIEELANLAQMGANAGASLEASGNPQLQELSGKIDEITGQLAGGGDISQASEGLEKLGASLEAIPAVELPSLPGGGRPSLPVKPSRP